MLIFRLLLNPDPAGEGASPAEEAPSDAQNTLEERQASVESNHEVPTDSDPNIRSDLDAAVRALEAVHAGELAERDRKAAAWERAYKHAVRERELATVLAGRPLVPGAASQLIKLWRDELDVFEDGGEVQVATRDGRSVTEAVAAWFNRPEYAHFLQPSSRGGTTPQGGNRSSITPAAPARARNLGEAVLQRWRDTSASILGDGATTIGLGRHKSN